MGSGHESETGNSCDLRVWVNAGSHGTKRFETSDGGKTPEEVGAAVQVWRSWKLVKAQIQVRRCDAAPIFASSAKI